MIWRKQRNTVAVGINLQLVASIELDGCKLLGKIWRTSLSYALRNTASELAIFPHILHGFTPKISSIASAIGANSSHFQYCP